MKFIDLEKQYELIKPQFDARLADLFKRQDFILGKDIDELEARLADYVGVKNCISCSNGTDALSMPLMLFNISHGDAVFTTTFTFFSTAEVIAQRGATPILVDCDKDTFNIDCDKLEEAIKTVIDEGRLRPRMIIPVDMFGLCADYDRLNKIANKYRMYVMEDGAQGFGASLNEKKACSFGDFSTTSFFPAKPLGCYGDGGAIFTDNDDWAKKLKSIRVHGKGKNKYENNILGLNARLDTIQAAALLCKLDIFDEEVESRNVIAKKYDALISDEIKKPVIPSGYKSVYAQYTVILPDYCDRAALMETLKAKGIPTMVYYERPMHLQKALKYLGYREGDFAVAEYVSNHALSLPMHPYLTDEEILFVCGELNDAASFYNVNK